MCIEPRIRSKRLGNRHCILYNHRNRLYMFFHIFLSMNLNRCRYSLNHKSYSLPYIPKYNHCIPLSILYIPNSRLCNRRYTKNHKSPNNLSKLNNSNILCNPMNSLYRPNHIPKYSCYCKCP